jgi:hypothetical protein
VVARLLTLAALIVSLVAFILQVTGSTDWWIFAMNRAGYVLVVLAVVAALLAPRTASLAVVVAEVLTAAAALAFATVGLVKYYDIPTFAIPYFGPALQTAGAWLGEAEVLSVAVLAFGLTLTRRRSTGAVAWLAAAVAMALGCGTYAITQKTGFTPQIWWEVATVGAFLAAAAAAGLERGGMSGQAGSDSAVEPTPAS